MNLDHDHNKNYVEKSFKEPCKIKESTIDITQFQGEREFNRIYLWQKLSNVLSF